MHPQDSKVWACSESAAERPFVARLLATYLDQQRSARAEEIFKSQVTAGGIQFRLRADGSNWRMPAHSWTYEPEGARELRRQSGAPLERSLFTPLYEADFANPDERDVGVYLDGERALEWWHRNVAKTQYSIQGWRRDKIYPDFIFAVRSTAGSTRVAIVEMKGEHLSGNDDTDYKRSVLELLSSAATWDRAVPSGALELVQPGGNSIECDLILFTEWRTRLPVLLSLKNSGH
jgi:type III restriction enzyme